MIKDFYTIPIIEEKKVIYQEVPRLHRFLEQLCQEIDPERQLNEQILEVKLKTLLQQLIKEEI